MSFLFSWCSTGGPEAHSAGWWLSLLNLISIFSGPQLIRAPMAPLAWCGFTYHNTYNRTTYNRTIASTLKMQIWIATSNRDMPRVMKTKFSATVMVFGVVSSEGHIMLPHIFEVGLKINTKVYLDVLKSVVIPWCNQVAGGRPWVWQQDSALAHKSKETQAWLQKECYDFVPFSHWSPSSLDLNPLDYFVWSYVENIINMTSHNTKASLIAVIRRIFAELPWALVEKACS